jgi:hypothetical protein
MGGSLPECFAVQSDYQLWIGLTGEISGSAKNLEKIYQKTVEEEAAREAYSNYQKKLGPMEKVGAESPAMKAFKELAIYICQKIEAGDSLPLLLPLPIHLVGFLL